MAQFCDLSDGRVAMELKAILALWGAVLSTFLALRDIARSRPQVTLECVGLDASPVLRLRIFNPARYPIHICRVKSIWPHDQHGAIQSLFVEDWELRDVVTMALEGRLDVYVPPQSEARIIFRRNDDQERLGLRIDWYRQWSIVLPTMPRFVFRSSAQVRQLFAHPLPESGLNSQSPLVNE